MPGEPSTAGLQKARFLKNIAAPQFRRIRKHRRRHIGPSAATDSLILRSTGTKWRTRGHAPRTHHYSDWGVENKTGYAASRIAPSSRSNARICSLRTIAPSRSPRLCNSQLFKKLSSLVPHCRPVKFYRSALRCRRFEVCHNFLITHDGALKRLWSSLPSMTHVVVVRSWLQVGDHCNPCGHHSVYCQHKDIYVPALVDATPALKITVALKPRGQQSQDVDTCVGGKRGAPVDIAGGQRSRECARSCQLDMQRCAVVEGRSFLQPS
ncbi:hypothetical protein FA95DRAFT_1115917 [Auriscalpium vulgare]|uniref:Uncharacterized protein n=1 Tax=Auriscalpium vulgare TaxID=40419 RepID=A0ACB8RW73_9AGAM|nr:hypothetical protein FA95DRAFT_1115917 [Auriscalpium vulgare]